MTKENQPDMIQRLLENAYLGFGLLTTAYGITLLVLAWPEIVRYVSAPFLNR